MAPFNSSTNRGGRKRGTPNKLTRDVRDAIVTAAAMLGADGEGRDGLVGYLMNIGRANPELMVHLLAKVLPLQVKHSSTSVHVELRSADEMRQALLSRGIRADRIFDSDEVDPPLLELVPNGADIINGRREVETERLIGAPHPAPGREVEEDLQADEVGSASEGDRQDRADAPSDRESADA